MCFAPLLPAVGAAAAGGTATAGGATILGTIGTVATIAGAGLSAYSLFQNNKAQADAAEATAVRQEIAAQQALEQGADESERRRRAGTAQIATNVAGMAANGVDVTSAQAIDIIDDDKFIVEEDAFSIRENARRTAEGFSQGAANSRAQAASADSAAFFQPIGTILTGAAKVGSKYSSWVTNKRLESRDAAGAF